MKKIVAFSLVLFVALVGFQMGAVKANASVKAPSISSVNNDPAPAPAPVDKKDEKKDDKKDEKKEEKKDDKDHPKH
jgi:ribosomal protein L12E/L44/L45/RPP1/RPP2